MRTFSQFVVTTLLVCVLWAAAMTQVHADPLQITWTVTDRFRLFSEADLPARERVDALMRELSADTHPGAPDPISAH